MKIIRVLMSVVFVAIFLSSTTAWAQSAKSIETALESYSSSLDELSRVEINLITMSEGVNEPEYNQVGRFLNSVLNVNGYAQTLHMVSNIYILMVDQKDAKSVRRFLSLSCYSFKKATDRASTAANSILPKLSTISVIQEITKGRDVLNQLNQSRLCKIVPEYKTE